MEKLPFKKFLSDGIERIREIKKKLIEIRNFKDPRSALLRFFRRNKKKLCNSGSVSSLNPSKRQRMRGSGWASERKNGEGWIGFDTILLSLTIVLANRGSPFSSSTPLHTPPPYTPSLVTLSLTLPLSISS
jgi:hypothetical protein